MPSPSPPQAPTRFLSIPALPAPSPAQDKSPALPAQPERAFTPPPPPFFSRPPPIRPLSQFRLFPRVHFLHRVPHWNAGQSLARRPQPTALTLLCQTPAAGASSSSACAVTCNPGTSSPSGLAPCTPCVNGTYNPFQRSTICLSCPQGYSTPSSSSIYYSQCVPNPACQQGYYSAVGLQPCSPCAKGFYRSHATPHQPFRA
jgi:hypothetical protein